MPSAAALVGNSEDPGLGFRALSADVTPSQPQRRFRSFLFATRLLLVWLLHVVDFTTDVWVAALLHQEGRHGLFAASLTFLVLPTLLRWCMSSFTMNPCTPDFLGLREENPPMCPRFAYIPILGELAVIADTIKGQWNCAQPNLRDKKDPGEVLVYLRLMEATFEATPQAIIQGLVLYEELSMDAPILYIQWQSFLLSFVAIAIGLSSVSVHRLARRHEEEQKHMRRKRFDDGKGAILGTVGRLCLTVYLGSDIFLRMNAIATLLYSPYATWFVVYAGTAYAGLPCLVVAGTLIGMMLFEKDKVEGKVSCCAHIGIVTIMYTGTLLTAACAFLIPLDVALCWQSPPFSWLRLVEHLAMSIISFLIGAPLTWVPLLLWFLSASTIVPSGLFLELYKLPCSLDASACLRRLLRCVSDLCPRGSVRVQPARERMGLGLAKAAEEPRSEWEAKVAELAMRSFTVGHLLEFCDALATRSLMPHFDASRSTTNDVVRQAIIPMSRLHGSWHAIRGGDSDAVNELGRALASCMEAEAKEAQVMITHNWDNLFSHLVAATVAAALGHCTFEKVLRVMENPRGIQALKNRCLEAKCSDLRIWICAFSINQHASICGGFGPEPPAHTPEHAAYDRKRRDTVTAVIYSTCKCRTPKYFNNTKDLCELNKFDAMMRHLAAKLPSFQQVVAVDQHLQLFQRAWCVAELVEARALQIQRSLVVLSQDCVSRKKTELLKQIRVQDCKASRPEDVQEILSKIADKERFNRELQDALFKDADSLFRDFYRNSKTFAQADLQVAAMDVLAT
ncbi:unnamed protein product [Symbiodinium sp. CCMP2592]|nr:unnamed protein product [Symbiodinium sp. CCMP2592]